MSLVRSQVPIHSATGAQCGDPGRIQTPVARVATACLVSRPRSLDWVARGRFELPLDGNSVPCLCQLGYGATSLLGATGGNRTRTLSLKGSHAALEHHGRS